MIQAELGRKIKGINDKNFDLILKQATTDAVSNILYKEYGVSRWGDLFIRPFVDAKLNESLHGKNWGLLVDTLAKEKIKSLI